MEDHTHDLEDIIPGAFSDQLSGRVEGQDQDPTDSPHVVLPENANNGMITKIWGPHAWVMFHSIAFGYPINPTEQQKEDYRIHYESYGKVLPCSYCRDSYSGFASTGETALTYNDLASRATLTHWTWRVHNRVNQKLCVDYFVSYEEFVKRYESYRAKCSKSKVERGCIMPLDLKANSYAIASIKDCPIISLNKARKFLLYAKVRDLNNLYYTLIVEDDIEDKLKNHKMSELVISRNKMCARRIKKMRIDGIPALEQSGPWEGLPTTEELKLIMMLSSTLCCDELDEVIKTLESKDIKITRTVRRLRLSSS